ncbi:TetR/AcrR family transcriptional regulator C-terminal domain-containing protein [Alicyclobacillus acidoterrestris]|uniref:TetR/AcrR family transcriptional regulator n=1 Tax=Alicyclobacillus acidoterrestris TaxID=1450 RepID=UPI003F534F24
MNNRTDKTDLRILRTRRLLRDAFVELLEEMDVEKITVNRLAERATINRVTFYLHYRDIPDMMDKLAEEMIEDIQQITRDQISKSPTGVVDEQVLLTALLEHIAQNEKFYKAVLATKRIPIFMERLLKFLSEVITERLEKVESNSDSSTANIQKDIAIWYGSSALIGVIVSWLQHDMPYTPRFLAQQFFLLLKE